MFKKIKLGLFTQMLFNMIKPVIMYAVSGITSSPDNLILSGCYLFIDDDTNASAIISGELFECVAEVAELFAGKGVKRSVYSKIKRFGVQFGCVVHDFTPKAYNILYGQYYATDASYSIWQYKNAIVEPTSHTFRIEAETVEDKDIKIYLFNAKNINFGQLPLDGEDFSGYPILIKPYPTTPSVDTELLCEIKLED
jgi:hypothetical protein